MTDKFSVLKDNKLIEVEAIQFTDKNKNQVFNWATSIQMNVWHDWDENKQPILMIPTLIGDYVCRIGDYLIKNPNPTERRKLYPCKEIEFKENYTKKTNNE